MSELLTAHLNKDCASIVQLYSFHEILGELAQKYLEERLPESIGRSLDIPQIAYDSISFLIDELHEMRECRLLHKNMGWDRVKLRIPALKMFPFFQELEELLHGDKFVAKYTEADDDFYYGLLDLAIDKDFYQSEIKILEEVP